MASQRFFRFAVLSTLLGVTSCGSGRSSGAGAGEPTQSPSASSGIPVQQGPDLDTAPADLPPEGLRPLMWGLASHVRDLVGRLQGERLDSPDPGKPPTPDEAAAILGEMVALVQAVRALPGTAAHAILGPSVDLFLYELETARRAALATPADLRPAAGVAGACLRCHAIRACPFDSYQKCVDVPIY